MLKICILLGLFVAIGASAIGETEEKPYDVYVQFVTSKNLESVLANYPHAVQIANKSITSEKSKSGQSRTLVQYTLGSRVYGDSRVSYDDESSSWSTPKDVKMTITYPASGYGAYVSYVKIDVNQSNGSGSAWVTSGGIGYRYIKIVVEAKNTYWFNYICSIYGYY